MSNVRAGLATRRGVAFLTPHKQHRSPTLTAGDY